VRWRHLVGVALTLTWIGVASTGPTSAATTVIGGTPIQIQSAPWSALVLVSSSYVQACSGSIIDASHVLTAAHCLYENSAQVQPSAVTIYAGLSNYADPLPGDVQQTGAVSSFRIHPSYAAGVNQNQADDVAVLALASPLDLSGPDVRAVALPSANAPFPAGTNVAAAGYGVESATSSNPSGALISLAATVDAQGQCGNETPSAFFQYNNAITLCATSPAGSLCHGDSGGGIVTAGGTPVLIAVHYATNPSCAIGSAAINVYVGAPEILSFIQGNDQPRTAPRTSSQTISRLAWNNPLAVGNTLTCSSNGWPDLSTQFSYSFVNAATGQVLQSGSHDRYLLPPSAAGTQIGCTVAAGNDGGTTIVQTSATPAIDPAPPISIKPRTPTTTRQGTQLTLHLVLNNAPAAPTAIRICASPPATVATHRCNTLHHDNDSITSVQVALTLTIKPHAHPGTTHIPINAQTPTSDAKTTATIRVTKR
jgi:Trypsin